MEATQEATQPCTDPRRLDLVESHFEDEDLSDIVCILHPQSEAAREAVAVTAATGPQHILQRDYLDHVDLNDRNVNLDIALRLSSRVRKLTTGFSFGRNRSSCDALLMPDVTPRRISNQHFRIYITYDGILMLQDSSTNGTLVDNNRLHKGSPNNQRMLSNGSIIQVIREEHPTVEVKFMVNVPSHEGHEMKYADNLVQYLQRVQDQETPGNRQPSVNPTLQWMGAQTYGMHWTGAPKYNVTGQVGKGAFATVYKLATRQHGVVYAAKELDKRRFMKNGVLDHKVDNELQIMRDLKHPNIVQYVDHHEHDRWIYIIMDYAPCGELSTYLQQWNRIPEPVVQQVARQTLRALHYLHKRKITHRDIKPDNILIASLDPLKIKLSDFGLSKMVQEETFLKTFCGTLLYCAPEVYPDYDTYRRGELRKRRRFGDPPPKTSPYDQSVDTWSFGAVLFHILAGEPPYSASSGDRGSNMLQLIMTSDPDYNVLRKVGVSDAGIDFVSRLLNRDPQSRPKERESFQHPWIASVEDTCEYEDDDIKSDCGDGLSDIDENAEEDLDASQLSIRDEAPDSFEDELAKSKRPRINDQPVSAHHFPSLPHLESIGEGQPDPSQATTPQRLFGEIIVAPALRSSHALGASEDAYEGDGFGAHDFLSSAGESMVSDDYSLNSIISLPEFPFAGSAPSLMGTENLVRQLRMSSSHPVLTTTNLHHHHSLLDNTGTPARQTSPADRNEAPIGGNIPATEQANPNEATPKASRFNRRIQLPIPDTASEVSSNQSRQSSRTRNRCQDGCASAPAPAAPSPATAPQAADYVDPELATTLDALTGKEIHAPVKAEAMPPIPPSTIDVIPPSVPAPQLRKPRPLLGKLTSLPGSIFDLTILLENRMTSWGRGPQATICHPDPMDTRIPAYALEVTFWTPAIESRIAAGDDWMSVPGVMAILSTKTRKCIWVNDTELRRGEEGREGLQFGKLYNGDIVTIYKHRNRFLKFQCEFYHGDSARSRPEQEQGFVVRKILKSREDGAVNRQPLQSKGEVEKKLD